MIAHIRGGKVIARYKENTGHVLLENGKLASPAVAGYVNGNDKVVHIVEETVDTSTTTHTQRPSVETVEDTRVLRTVTVTDIPIEDIRAAMDCTPMQGILTIGETKWREVLQYRDTASWEEKVIIDSAQTWQRNSENIQFIGFLIDFDDDDMDAMFTAAVSVSS
jgi:hypothetical protein